MKTFILLLISIVNPIYSQVCDVLTNLNSAGIANIIHKDNYIYFTAYSQKKVYRFNKSLTSPICELVYQFNENPNFIYEKNNILYVGVESPFKTYKINLASEIIQPIILATIAGPMVQIDNDLLIGQYLLGKITKINLDTNIQTDILLGYKPNFFTLYNNELYFTSNTTNTLYKYNTSTDMLTVVLTNLSYAAGVAINDDYLFICQSTGNSILYYSQPNFEFESAIQLAPNSWPNGITIADNELYFVQTVAGKVSKVLLDSSLSNTLFSQHNPKFVNIYPNPSIDEINIESKYTFEKYEIYTVQGKLIQSSNIINNKINVSNLSKGHYILMLDKKPHKFIKQ